MAQKLKLIMENMENIKQKSCGSDERNQELVRKEIKMFYISRILFEFGEVFNVMLWSLINILLFPVHLLASILFLPVIIADAYYVNLYFTNHHSGSNVGKYRMFNRKMMRVYRGIKEFYIST